VVVIVPKIYKVCCKNSDGIIWMNELMDNTKYIRKNKTIYEFDETNEIF